MPEYIVMFPADNEAEMDARTDAERRATFDTDYEFGQLLVARGRAMTGGAGLTRSKARTDDQAGTGGTPARDRGPFAETVEQLQLSGFFVVTCDDYDALVEAAEVLVRAHPVVEIRPVKEF